MFLTAALDKMVKIFSINEDDDENVKNKVYHKNI
jgi:hypothetical protein